MPRIRMVKPEFFDDPNVGDLSPLARLFFIGLWTQADREGRLVDDMRRLKARIFPYEETDVEALADELHRKDMIRRYQDGTGTHLIWVRQFSKHQRPHHKETASVIAACPSGGGKHPNKVSACPERASANPPDSGVLILDPGSLESGVLESGSKPSLPRRVLRLSPEGFEAFWGAYPRKVGKGAARAEWVRLRPTAELQTQMLAELDRQRSCDQWTKDGGQFIPFPRTWLHQGRWEDEPGARRVAKNAGPQFQLKPWACRIHEPTCAQPETHCQLLEVEEGGQWAFDEEMQDCKRVAGFNQRGSKSGARV